MNRNTGHVDGEEAELAVAAHLVRQGCRVSHTHGLYKYDLVADKDDELLRVQVKKANQNNEKPWKYRLFTEQYQGGQVDIFAGYIVEEDNVFYVAFDEVGRNNFRVNTKDRAELSDHNASEANLLEDYTFERAFRQYMTNTETEEQNETSSSDPVERQ
ncbi:group I intron-associated PD-(D/E)XK endonuclease [Halorubrum ezzemoulense]|uniref:group I intron-associated PD-(D/E)XK endonuclease n=1 Tax=Halorubrum ezzemoulense TaxID=337243 RepID=UPI00232BCD50|nr:group I intron-associated PD-(D/E)XK endonuclease [Halorubrum ezzemoulense]MDB2283385.1 group I intron-associated PD-(D/E)XK endonuclease [Halorubrum ezzemoulense]